MDLSHATQGHMHGRSLLTHTVITYYTAPRLSRLYASTHPHMCQKEAELGIRDGVETYHVADAVRHWADAGQGVEGKLHTGGSFVSCACYLATADLREAWNRSGVCLVITDALLCSKGMSHKGVTGRLTWL